MSDPIVEQIAKVIKARLATVTKRAGCNQNFIVKRPDREGIDTIEDNLVALYPGASTADTDLAPNGIVPGNPPMQCWKRQWSIELISRQSDKDSTAAEAYVNTMCSDAIKAVTLKGDADEAVWHTFGDLAYNALIGEPDTVTDGTTWCITLPLDVWYRTNENDPYTAR